MNRVSELLDMKRLDCTTDERTKKSQPVRCTLSYRDRTIPLSKQMFYGTAVFKERFI